MFDGSTPKPVKNLSVSKIEKFLLCPKNFELAYVHQIPQPQSWKPFGGVVVHKIIESAMKQFSKTDKYPDWQSMDDQYEPLWAETVKEYEKKPGFIGWQDDPKDPLETLKPEYRKLIRLAREQVLPTINPWRIGDEPVVEWRIDFDLRSKVGTFPIIGYADLLDSSGVLMDWKSTGKEVSKRAKSNWLQFAAYSIWAWPILGEPEVRCEKIFLARGGGEPFVERVPFVVGPKHREYFVRTAAQIWETIQRQIYICNHGTWLCKPDFCPFWAGCAGELSKEHAHDEESAAA